MTWTLMFFDARGSKALLHTYDNKGKLVDVKEYNSVKQVAVIDAEARVSRGLDSSLVMYSIAGEVSHSLRGSVLVVRLTGNDTAAAGEEQE